jgi:hypothetical protein
MRASILLADCIKWLQCYVQRNENGCLCKETKWLLRSLGAGGVPLDSTQLNSKSVGGSCLYSFGSAGTVMNSETSSSKLSFLRRTLWLFVLARNRSTRLDSSLLSSLRIAMIFFTYLDNTSTYIPVDQSFQLFVLAADRIFGCWIHPLLWLISHSTQPRPIIWPWHRTQRH